MNIMHTMASQTRTTQVPKRRFYSLELKLQVVQICACPGASIAAVALQHGINANIVHRWIREHSQGTLVTQPQAFVPVTLSTQPGVSDRLSQRLVLHGFGAKLRLGPVPLQQLLEPLTFELARFGPGPVVLAVGPGHIAHSVQPAAARGTQLPKQRRVLRARFKRLLESAQVARQARGSGLKHGQFAHDFLLLGF